MVFEELSVRLNDRGYKNWLKAGRCLLILKEGLRPCVDQRVKAFHGDLLNRHAPLRKPCPTSSCRPRGNKLSSACRGCAEWQAVILKHHRQPRVTVNWDNCSPPSWRTDHWELAKAYMPRGQGKAKGAHECDAAALLNLMNYCDIFQSVDPKLVSELIRYRNELMHSCELRVRDDWMRHYQITLKNFMHQFCHVPQMTSAAKQIDEMLAADLSIWISGMDQMDSVLLQGLETDSLSKLESTADLVSQWEAELLQEKLQLLLHASAAADDDDAKTQDTNELKSLGSFLQANKDLGERFSAELKAINSLEARE